MLNLSHIQPRKKLTIFTPENKNKKPLSILIDPDVGNDNPAEEKHLMLTRVQKKDLLVIVHDLKPNQEEKDLLQV